MKKAILFSFITVIVLLIAFYLFLYIPKLGITKAEKNKPIQIKKVEDNVIQKPNNITMEDLKFGDIKLNITRDQLSQIMKVELLGNESNSQTKQKDESLEEYLTYKDGTVILLIDNIVSSILVTNSNYQTPRGLKVGDNESKLIKLYGKWSYVNKNKRIYFYGAEEYDVFIVTVINGIITEIKVKLAS